MDGPIGVTQCALGSKQSQEYVFEAYPAGTHFWHAHGSMHASDGLSGPIVIHPKTESSDPFEYDEERVIFLQDWYIQTSTQQLIGLKSFPFTWIGNPNSLLINGKGLAAECLPDGGVNFNDTLKCQIDLCVGPALTDQLSVIPVEVGKTYRFRIINDAQLVMMNIAMTGHNMTIVQVEGTNVEPITVSSLDLAPGQRYDVLITMDEVPSTYILETVVRERDMPGVHGMALIQYAGATEGEYSDTPLHPVWNDTAFGVALDEALLTTSPETHPQAAALTTSKSDVTRYVVVGTQNRTFPSLPLVNCIDV
jgi:FtsP/CotA-like multicopper oxidase with cupredoxin domain